MVYISCYNKSIHYTTLHTHTHKHPKSVPGLLRNVTLQGEPYLQGFSPFSVKMKNSEHDPESSDLQEKKKDFLVTYLVVTNLTNAIKYC